MSPRADYFCERCEAKGLCSPANPWRDLPIKKPKCPECGASRWMKRLYSGYSPNISTGGDMQRFKAADALAEPAMLAHQAKHDAALRAEAHARQAESVVPGINMRVRAVRSDQLPGALAGFQASANVTPGKATSLHDGRLRDPVLSQTQPGFAQDLRVGAPRVLETA